jgi:predicted permease
MTTLLQDFRHAWRSLLSRPTYAAVTILVLAVALGANTTLFSIFNGFFLRPLPYPDDARLVSVYNVYPKMSLAAAGSSIPDYLDRREQAHSLEALALYTTESRTLTGNETPERIVITRASPALFRVLGVAPLLGRGFAEDEATPGNDHVAVLSHRLWSARFGARADILGSDVELDGERFRVVGVMPERFGFPNRDVAALVPYAFTAEQAGDDQRGNESSGSIGRLRPGSTIATLNAEMDAIVRRNLDLGRLSGGAAFIEATGFTGRAKTLREMTVGGIEPVLLILHGIVLSVLLIACANVANLQLARMAARRKELAVRAALGAGRWRLARLVLVESTVLAVLGGLVGLLVAAGGLELVRALGLDLTSRGFEFEIDPLVLAFTAGAALAAAFSSGLVPLIALLREDLVRSVHDGGRLGGGGRRAHGFRSALVVVQISVSVALLVSAGLLTKSFYEVQRENPGFDSENVWTARIALPEGRFREPESRARFLQQVLEALRALPGVSDAGFTSTLPFAEGNAQASVDVDGYTPPAGVASPHAQQRSISEGYLPSLDIGILEGRNFASTEADFVAIVDENMANNYWPNGNVLGQRIRHYLDPRDRWYTIVGVVPAVRQTSLAELPTKETIYWHYQQRPTLAGMLTLRTSLSQEQLTRAARDAVLGLDPDLPLADVLSMETRVRRSLGPQRVPMALTLVFAVVAFLLSLSGVYGVLTWAVSQRRGEIGVRVALGAERHTIVRMVLREGVRLIAIGLAFGVIGAIGIGSLLASQIRDINAFDPVVFAAALTGLTAAALFASWLPARRASRIDATRALRAE